MPNSIPDNTKLREPVELHPLLAEFPAQLKEQRLALHALNQKLVSLQAEKNILMAEIDRAVAFDDSLKNEAKRKAKRLQLIEESAVLAEANEAIDSLSISKELLWIDTHELEERYAIAKLSVRYAIALHEK